MKEVAEDADLPVYKNSKYRDDFFNISNDILKVYPSFILDYNKFSRLVSIDDISKTETRYQTHSLVFNISKISRFI